MTGKPKSLGQINYETFCEKVEWVPHWEAGCSTFRKEAWSAAALAIRREISGWLVCDRCAGLGTISERHGTSFETDSAEERAACWYQVPCPACEGLGRVQPDAKN